MYSPNANRSAFSPRVARQCDVAQSFGLKFTSEFCPLTAGNPSLDRAKWLVDQVGRDCFAIGVDMLHTVRSGATAAGQRRVRPGIRSGWKPSTRS